MDWLSEKDHAEIDCIIENAPIELLINFCERHSLFDNLLLSGRFGIMGNKEVTRKDCKDAIYQAIKLGQITDVFSKKIVFDWAIARNIPRTPQNQSSGGTDKTPVVVNNVNNYGPSYNQQYGNGNIQINAMNMQLTENIKFIRELIDQLNLNSYNKHKLSTNIDFIEKEASKLTPDKSLLELALKESKILAELSENVKILTKNGLTIVGYLSILATAWNIHL